jgi:hypothetical protein
MITRRQLEANPAHHMQELNLQVGSAGAAGTCAVQPQEGAPARARLCRPLVPSTPSRPLL